MSEETILKNSIFGGYKKSDVINYIDAVSEENDKKVKKMEEQIILLTKENNKLKNQFIEEKKRLEASEGNSRAESKHLQQDKNGMVSRDRLPLRQQMKLTEGTYLVSKEHAVINLPEPFPAYQTKEKGAIMNSIAEAKDETIYENQTDEIAITEQSYDETKSAYKIALAPKEPVLSEGIKEMQAQLKSIKELLEKEKSEKQALAAKLEFCNDLLLKLYKK